MLNSLVLGFLLATLGANAQTENTAEELPNSTPISLEDKYQQELDRWMLQAYEGNQDAQFKVGVLFTNDQFNSADFEQAVYWYKQAARQGHVLAQYNLGHQYITGVGVKRSEVDAMAWWLKAAEQDHPLAQFNVGRAYYLGIGLAEDHGQSRHWFRRAAQNQEPKSIEILGQLGWAEPGEFTVEPVVSRPENVESSPPAASQVTAAVTPSPQSDQSTAPTGEQTAATEDMPVANQTPVAIQNDITPTQATEPNPIAVYTNPATRSVLIAIIDARDQLEVISEGDEWTNVTSRLGIPVWVHQNYVSVNNSSGTIKGSAVNARSVPIIAAGTIVGKLNDGETLAVIDQKEEWYRLMSPARFQAWVKTDEFNTVQKSQQASQADAEVASNTTLAADSSEAPSSPDRDGGSTQDEWLFGQPSDNYTLQLASFSDPEKIAEFESRKKFKDNPNLHRFVSMSQDTEWTYFLYGNYPSSEVAKTAREEIGQKLAWVRSFQRLQQNRCVAWKKQIPAPKALNKYCLQ